MGVGLLVGVWVARYLGPEQFGQFNYAMAYVVIFGAIAGLGMNGVVVRELVRKQCEARATLGSAFTLLIIGGFVAAGLAVFTIFWLRPDDMLTKAMVVILSIGLIFKSTDVVKYWFESQLQSRYSVWVENSIFIVMAGIKVVMIVTQATLLDFVLITLTETILVAVGLLVIYIKKANLVGVWEIKITIAKKLLADCWPLIFSSLAVTIYLRIDQVMLAEMVDDHAVGIYSAAVRISEVWYFIPMAIVGSVLPSVVRAKEISETVYENRLQRLYDLMVALSLIIAIPMTFLSDVIISILFGDAYQGAGSILSINIWAGVFVFLGAACGVYTNVENIPKYSLMQTLLGMLVNIALNYILIPVLGVTGAAIATVFSYAISALSALFFNRTRRNGILMLKSLVIFNRRWILNSAKL